MLNKALATTIFCILICACQTFATPQNSLPKKCIFSDNGYGKTHKERKGNPKLVIIGSVLAEGIEVAGATIQLLDLDTGKQESFVTKGDGNFFFNLVTNKKYEVQLIDADGTIVKKEIISTINKSTPDIIHIYMEDDRKK